jgi:hypothetical protein
MEDPSKKRRNTMLAQKFAANFERYAPLVFRSEVLQLQRR